MVDKKENLDILDRVPLSPGDNETLYNFAQLVAKKQELRDKGIISVNGTFVPPESLSNISNVKLDDNVSAMFLNEKSSFDSWERIFVALQDIDNFAVADAWVPCSVIQALALDFMKQSISLRSLIGIADQLVGSGCPEGDYVFMTSNLFLDSKGYSCLLSLKKSSGNWILTRMAICSEHKIEKNNVPYKFICLVD